MFLFYFWEAQHTSKGPHFLFCFCFYFTNKHMQTLKLKLNRFVGSTVRHNDHDRQNAHKQTQIQTIGGHIFHKHQQTQPIFSVHYV